MLPDAGEFAMTDSPPANDVVPETPRPWWRRVLRSLFVYCAVPYLSVAALMAVFQRDLMYAARRSNELSASQLDPGNDRLIDLEITTHDGLTLRGLLLRGVPERRAAAGEKLVVCFPGNAGHRGHRYFDCQEFADLGFDVVMFDYRGYGDNPGRPNETDIVEDAWALWQLLTKGQHIPPEQIILFGESLGGGVAVQLAARACRAGETPGGLVVQSTFSSMTEAAQSNYPFLPVSLLLLDRYPSIDHIRAVDCPLVILHGDADTIVPFELGRKLYDAAPPASANGTPKQFIRLEGLNHNNVPRGVLGEAVGSLVESR